MARRSEHPLRNAKVREPSGPQWTDPLAHLRLCPGWREDLERIQRDAVEAARQDGRTWAQIGEALGISCAAVHKRYSGEIG